MHIGIDIRHLSPIRTGVGEYTFELLNALFSIDQKNQYYLFYNAYHGVADQSAIFWKQNNVHYIKTNWPNKILNTAIQLLKSPKLDQLIINNCQLNSLDNSSSRIKNLDVFFSPNLNFTSLTKRSKHILTIHDLSFDFFPEFYTLKQRWWHTIINPKKQCQTANVILTPSENTKRDLIDYYSVSPEKIKVLHPGLSPSFTVADNKATTLCLPNKYILFLGTIEPRKNIISVIKAYELYLRSSDTAETWNPPLSRLPDLVIAGAPGWKNKEMHSYITRSSYRDKIKILGLIRPEDKPSLYANASLFVYPSFYEGFGFPVLEALASQIPVIASNRSSIPEITGDAGYLVNPNNINDIAKGIKLLLENDGLRSIKIKKGLKQARKFNWQTTSREFLKIVTAI